jgi:hypothetical protein
MFVNRESETGEVFAVFIPRRFEAYNTAVWTRVLLHAGRQSITARWLINDSPSLIFKTPSNLRVCLPFIHPLSPQNLKVHTRTQTQTETPNACSQSSFLTQASTEQSRWLMYGFPARRKLLAFCIIVTSHRLTEVTSGRGLDESICIFPRSLNTWNSNRLLATGWATKK